LDSEEEQDSAPRWLKIVGGDFKPKEVFCVDMRRLQARRGCSTATCNDFIKTFAKYLRIDAPKTATGADRKICNAAGAHILQLNGCVGCDDHVFHPSEEAVVCPSCAASRFDAHGKPFEVSECDFLLACLNPSQVCAFVCSVYFTSQLNRSCGS
jgi:hypothetical protein